MNILSSAVESHLRGYCCQVASFFTQPVRKLSHVTVKPLIRADVRRAQLTTMADQARSPGAVLKLREGVSQTNADIEEMWLPSITMGAYALLMQSNAIFKKRQSVQRCLWVSGTPSIGQLVCPGFILAWRCPVGSLRHNALYRKCLSVSDNCRAIRAFHVSLDCLVQKLFGLASSLDTAKDCQWNQKLGT